MLALAIYDKLVDYDLTNGLKIVGTGTIDFYGNIGQIDGVKYKLKGAVNKGADVFLAPSGKNYKECVELKNKNGYNINIIEVKHFDDAIRSLKQLGSEQIMKVKYNNTFIELEEDLEKGMKELDMITEDDESPTIELTGVSKEVIKSLENTIELIVDEVNYE